MPTLYEEVDTNDVHVICYDHKNTYEKINKLILFIIYCLLEFLSVIVYRQDTK